MHQGIEAARMAAGMAWQVGWSLVLGFLISGILQASVSRARMTAALGRGGFGAVALATVAGIASSSCSYAAASVSRTLFKRGAGLVASLAFLVASTNLVVELGLVLYLLMGWRFVAGEWVGGVVLIAILALLVRATYPARLVEQARAHGEPAGRGTDAAGSLLERATWVRVAQNFVADWRMLWRDIVLGFVIAGALSALVPAGVWAALFVTDAPGWVQVPANAMLGPLVAVMSFVCSIGNVPMAAVLWGSGVSFGGVLAFLYADLIVLPLLDVYRRYYGARMAGYIAVMFYATMVLSAIAIDLAFGALGLIPRVRPDVVAAMTSFSVNYTFWLNLVALAVAAALVVIARRAPVAAPSCCAHQPAVAHAHH